jgi:hypothetical protein
MEKEQKYNDVYNKIPNNEVDHKACIKLFDPQIRWKTCYKHVFHSFIVNFKQ